MTSAPNRAGMYSTTCRTLMRSRSVKLRSTGSELQRDNGIAAANPGRCQRGSGRIEPERGETTFIAARLDQGMGNGDAARGTRRPQAHAEIPAVALVDQVRDAKSHQAAGEPAECHLHGIA